MEQFISLMEKYFAEEKAESLVFFGVGILSILFGIYAYSKGGVLMKNMTYPIVIVGLIQIIVGGTVFLRTDKQVKELKLSIAVSPQTFKQEEGKRMEVVMKSFRNYKILEIVLCLTALCLIIGHASFGVSESWAGVGAGLILQSSLMLVADLFAEQRGQLYYNAILNLS
jgi:hypothetical protein